MEIQTQIQLRRDIRSVWELENPILADGEIGIESDTNRIKIGDGVRSWIQLPYFNSISDEITISNFGIILGSNVNLTNNDESSLIEFPISNYRSAEFLIQITYEDNFHIQKILAVHNSSEVRATQFGKIVIGQSCGRFDVDLYQGKVRLLFKPSINAAMNVRISSTLVHPA